MYKHAVDNYKDNTIGLTSWYHFESVFSNPSFLAFPSGFSAVVQKDAKPVKMYFIL